MPIVEVHLLEGYAPEEKTRLTAALTDAVRFVVAAPDDAITVMLRDVPAANYARGGQSRRPGPARPEPIAVVRGFLSAMQARDLAAAQEFLANDFNMIFPGTGPMTSLAELIDWAKGRYRFVVKSFEAFEAFQGEGAAVVYVRGALAGQWPDGTPFDGIRFIDRFEVVAGKLARQDVWNDLAERRAS